MANILTTATSTRKNALVRRNEDTDVALAISPATGATAIALRYDYAQIPAEHRDATMRAATDIHTRGNRINRDIVAIGGALAGVKDRIPHGQFMEWCAAEFAMTDRTARNFMAAHEKFKDKPPTMLEAFSLSALYLLASSEVSDKAIEVAYAESVTTGAPMTKKRAGEIAAENPKPKPGRPKTKPAPVIIDGTINPPKKTEPKPAESADLRRLSDMATEALDAFLAAYETTTGDTESPVQLRKIFARMVAKIK